MPAPRARRDQSEIADALGAFEAALRIALGREAQQAVERAAKRLQRDEGGVWIKDIEVDVVLRSVTIESASPSAPRRLDPTPPTGPSETSERQEPGPQAAASQRGRPPGALRTAILQIVTGETEISVGAIRDALAGRGLEASADNLHQHLRRLVKAGELERAGRGTYKLAT